MLSISKERRVFYGVIGMILIVLLTGLLFIHQLSKPVRAQTFTTPDVQAPAAPSLLTAGDTYATFSYPSSLQAITGEAPTGDEVDAYNYTKADVEPWHLVIDINHLQQPSLMYDSAYMLRKDDPERYQSSTVTTGGTSFTIMTDTKAGDFSKAAFSVHEDYSVDIALTGDDGSNETTLTSTFGQVLQSWEWKN